MICTCDTLRNDAAFTHHPRERKSLGSLLENVQRHQRDVERTTDAFCRWQSRWNERRRDIDNQLADIEAELSRLLETPRPRLGLFVADSTGERGRQSPNDATPASGGRQSPDDVSFSDLEH